MHYSSRSRSDEVEEELARWCIKTEHKDLVEGQEPPSEEDDEAAFGANSAATASSGASESAGGKSGKAGKAKRQRLQLRQLDAILGHHVPVLKALGAAFRQCREIEATMTDKKKADKAGSKVREMLSKLKEAVGAFEAAHKAAQEKEHAADQRARA